MLEAKEIIKYLAPHLTESRKAKIKRIVAMRNKGVHIFLENIYDNGNINAVMRTAENFGYYKFHIVKSTKTRNSNRITRGADRWLELQRYPDTITCLKQLKAQGLQIIATTLTSQAKPLTEITFRQPCVFVFGNEKDGVSQDVLRLADQHCIIPAVGFSQSFNISVAAAICLSYLFFNGPKMLLSSAEQEELIAKYYQLSSQSHMKALKQQLNGLEETLFGDR